MSTKRSNARAQAPSPGPRRLAVCIELKRDGQRCKAAPLRGTRKCALHTPGNAQRLGAKGGMRRAIFDPDKLLHFEAPKTVDEVLSILGQISVEIHRGEIDPRVAATLTTTLTALLNGIEVKEQGALLEELERRCGLQDSMSQLRDQVTGRFMQ
jgi:hypothetical protein